MRVVIWFILLTQALCGGAYAQATDSARELVESADAALKQAAKDRAQQEQQASQAAANAAKRKKELDREKARIEANIKKVKLEALLRAEEKRHECAGYIGKQIEAVTIGQAAAKLAPLARTKDEFETTESFNARLAKAAADAPVTLVVKTQFDSRFAAYNADKQEFEIVERAMGMQMADYSDVFGVRGGSGDSLVSLYAIVSKGDKIKSRYKARNAFGAEAEITRLERRTATIFDQQLARGYDLFGGDHVLRLAAPPADARKLKTAMQGAVVFAPLPPYYALGYRTQDAKINSPWDIIEVTEAVIGYIPCSLILDAEGGVLASSAR